MATAARNASHVIVGRGVVAPGGILSPGWMEVAGDRIVGIGAGDPPRPADYDLGGQWLVPGFVDIHVHGGAGVAFGDGVEEARQVAAFHRANGTTTMHASLVTRTLADLEGEVRELADLVDDGLLAGIHLEGPFLSHARCGAHEPTLLRAPARDDVARLLEAGRGTVRMVTLAPELEGGLDAVRQIVDGGAIAAVGHTDAPFDVVTAAVDAGARVGTHLFNGMPPLHHRTPGPVAALLNDPRVVVEVINDGMHLDPAVVRTAVRAAGQSRVALITDAMAAAGMGDGRYRLGSLDTVVENGMVRLADGGSLAGSTLTMADAFRRAALDLGLDTAVAMASATPAQVIGARDVGALAPGNRADIVAVDDTFQLTAVMAGGAWVELG
ncbi:N-acetylglucosamine-6-phosphate deacetylase [Spiractinospora alimapuensis]|uniref:N-acetylglucosamine-6-phosphate deacetylase n=1 Tax=Spiractinospora alimapuensis TaxID=2820884 RepID=UPI001EEB1904|nr:N-acetylglucosamine-6-phosphate deacetylase [Spiractinospora alimapuensis]QVQ50085.1 N-acetylglucosamine-6-phosphate deacetylase [Spiractinospora alimapuensis]